MIAGFTRRAGAAALIAGLALLATAGPAAAEPRELVCTIGGSLGAPVTLQEGEQVQLVLVVPLLGTRLMIGPAQTAQPGAAVLSGAVNGVLGIVNGTLCRVAVQVQTTVAPVLPLPEVPTLPPLLPSQSVQVPLPGIDVSVEQPGAQTPPPPNGPGGSQPPPAAQPPADDPAGPATPPSYRFEPGSLPSFGLGRAPSGVTSRFGPGAAPAFRFGERVPGYAPQFGVLDEQAVADAGAVEALPLGRTGAVALPVLFAVLMLSAVAGALVRTWVLRRTL